MKDDIKKICEKEKTKESCGIILFAKNRFRVRECNNISEFPEQQFEISFFDHCECIKEGEIVGIYHSHITENEEFSDIDSVIQEIKNCNPVKPKSIQLPIITNNLGRKENRKRKEKRKDETRSIERTGQY